MAASGLDPWGSDARDLSPPFAQELGVLDPRCGECLELLQLLGSDRGLELWEPPVESDHVAEVGHTLVLHHGLGVVADKLEPLGEPIVIRDDDAAFTDLDRLVPIEAEYAEMAETSGRAALVPGSWCLRRILDDRDPALGREGDDTVEVRRMSEDIDH